MSAHPARPAPCPTCGAALEDGAPRCRACGRVFGPDNHCAECNAFAAVRITDTGFVCVACGAPRERLARTVVLGAKAHGGIPKPTPSAAVITARVASGALGIGALSSAAVGIVGATTWAFLADGPWAWAGVALSALVGGGASLGFWRLSRAARRHATQTERARRELALFALAERSDGDLTATEVARHFGVTSVEAEAMLTAIADGTRVRMEIDSDGLVRFDFHELASTPPPVRVRAPHGGRSASVEEEESSAAASSNPRRGSAR